MKKLTLLLALALVQSASSAALPSWHPDTLEWKIRRPNGTLLTFLEGDWETAGPITYVFKMPDGAWYPAHTHPSTARIVVLKGTLLLGEGADADPAKARAYPAGSIAIVPAGAPHFEGARGETVIVGFTVGPWSTTFLKP